MTDGNKGDTKRKKVINRERSQQKSFARLAIGALTMISLRGE